MTIFGKLVGALRGRPGRRFSAIDFDSRHLRLAEAELTSAGVRIIKLATTDMPADIDMADALAIGTLIGRTLDEMKLRNTAIIMSVPRGQAILKPLVLPPVATTSELAAMVQYQAEKELSFRPDEAVVDFTLESHYGTGQTAGQESAGENVLVAAVRRPVVEYYKTIAQTAGASLVRLGLRPYANMRCMETYVQRGAQERVALVDITADEAEIDVIESGVLTFSRSAVLKVPAAGDDEAALRDAVGAVASEVARSLQSYLGVERGHKIDSVLVAGGTGIEAAVAEELTRRLAIRCERFNPAPALGLEQSGPEASAFVSALGLAYGQAPGAAVPFDFLNPKRPVVKRDYRKLGAAAVAASFLLVILAVVASASVYYYTAESQLGALTEQFNKLKEENRKIGALAKRVETLDGWVHGGRNWLDQWAYLSAVFPSCVETYVTSLKTNPDGSVSFVVKAKNNEAINDLGKRLAAAGYDFKPGQVTTGGDPYGYTYSTTVKILVKSDMKVDLAAVTAVPRPEDDASAKEFGKPPTRTEAARPEAAKSGPPVGSPSAAAPAAQGDQTPYQAWRGRMEAMYKDRPPSSDAEARKTWAQKYEALMKDRPPPDPPQPPPPSPGKKRNHD
ncbi:MAG: pilus assembly protein PilM [Planctomycetota bacterium]|nr:pilus assembly protein PilM [Planctomycetota bacterium]